MKLSEITTKLTCMKSKAMRVLAAATLAGAALAAVPAAQRIECDDDGNPYYIYFTQRKPCAFGPAEFEGAEIHLGPCVSLT